MVICAGWSVWISVSKFCRIYWPNVNQASRPIGGSSVSKTASEFASQVRSWTHTQKNYTCCTFFSAKLAPYQMSPVTRSESGPIRMAGTGAGAGGPVSDVPRLAHTGPRGTARQRHQGQHTEQIVVLCQNFLSQLLLICLLPRRRSLLFATVLCTITKTGGARRTTALEWESRLHAQGRGGAIHNPDGFKQHYKKLKYMYIIKSKYIHKKQKFSKPSFCLEWLIFLYFSFIESICREVSLFFYFSKLSQSDV